jgi:hypothetical protein
VLCLHTTLLVVLRTVLPRIEDDSLYEDEADAIYGANDLKRSEEINEKNREEWPDSFEGIWNL